MKLNLMLILSLTLFSGVAWSKPKAPEKGILNELRADSKDEKVNQKKEVQSEVMITKTENEAINALINIIKKKKGSPQEPELWLRLGELYQRRAKSGRFFDLFRDDKQVLQFAPPQASSESAKRNLLNAIAVFDKIEKSFPSFRQMDAVLYNNAFSRQQIGEKEKAAQLYAKLSQNFPKSSVVPDALLALGELYFEKSEFAKSLETFLKIEDYKRSKVYAYGMYKAAWAYYNMRQTDQAIAKLKQVIVYFRTEGTQEATRQNVRNEALKDLAIFFSDLQNTESAYEFFAGFANFDEIGWCLLNLAKLNNSHSKFKESTGFLEDFIKKQPASKYVLEAHLVLIDSYEELKEKDKVITNLKGATEICRPNSKWYVANSASAQSICENDLLSKRSEIAKRWWDQWLKKKDNKELASLIEKVFEMTLEKKSTLEADLKTRFAYADLLFQQKKYRASSMQYEFVSDNVKDKTLDHDATYGALVSFQKAVDEQKQTNDNAKLEELSLKYLNKHKEGAYTADIQLKMAVLSYEKNDLVKAESYLKTLMQGKSNPEIKRKAEDLYLDLLNARKDFKSIQQFTQNVTTKEQDTNRKSELSKIFDEASFAEIQELNNSGKKDLAADKLYEFHKKNLSSNLAKEALWQSLSINYSLQKELSAANQSVEFYDKYQNDKRALESLKEAARVYHDYGFTDRAAVTLERVAKVSEKDKKTSLLAAAELYNLDQNYQKAQIIYKALIPLSDKSEIAALYEGLLNSLKSTSDSSELQATKTKIINLKVEPLASRLRIEELRNLVAAKKTPQAFNLSKGMVNDSGLPADIRAEARLIQANILEAEFLAQPTRTSIDRLATVLGIKTEKLDKAQTAYISVGQIADSADLKIKALQGLERVYGEYIRSIKNLNLKTELSVADRKALDDELSKLIAPIEDRKKENSEKLKIASQSRATSGSPFAKLTVDDTFQPSLDTIEVPTLTPYWLYLDSSKAIKPFTATTGCPNESTSNEFKISALPVCIQTKKWDLVEKQLVQLGYAHKGLSLYYRALLAHEKKLWDKARWLIMLYSKDPSMKAYASYETARTLYLEKQLQLNEQDKSLYMTSLGESYDLGLKNAASIKGKAFTLYQTMQCSKMIALIDSESPASSKVELAPLKAECMSVSGDFDGAAKELEALAASSANPQIQLYIAHIHEKYRFDSMSALQAYEKALKQSKAQDQSNWINAKIEILKGPDQKRMSAGENKK